MKLFLLFALKEKIQLKLEDEEYTCTQVDVDKLIDPITSS